jgi:ParB-like chromosome segregation protein Spo0J
VPDGQEVAAEWWDIARLKPWDRNPRKNKEAIHRVADSIRRFGFASPIVARKENGEIIAGHTRFFAAKLLGLKKVPVRALDIDESKAHLLALADNKLGEIAEWDDEQLGALLAESSFGDALAAGWDGDELGKLASAIIGSHDLEEDASEEASGLKYQLIVECTDEEHQAVLMERLEAEGLPCKPLIS